MNKYDPKYWKHGNNITVEQFCRYVMQQIPRDAVFYVCGNSSINLHFSPEGNIFSIDCDSLSDLPEYEGGSIGEITTEALYLEEILVIA